MSLAHLIPPQRPSMKRFPPNAHGVLLPAGNRRAAALGVCMYTASSSRALVVQRAAYWAVRMAGVRLLPGASEPIDLPGDAESWRALTVQWENELGPLHDLTIYRRRQAHRDGLTMIAVRDATPVAVIKVRDDATGIAREQQALRVLSERTTHTFSAPRPLGHGSAGGMHWSAQQVVFERPHVPVLEVPRGLYVEISDALSTLLPPDGDMVAAHGDLTPWNLRRDHRGRVWLFDWEDWALAPRDADRAYFTACSRAVGGRPMPLDLPSSAIAHHRPVVEARRATAPRGETLSDDILAAFVEAEGR